MKLHYRKRQTPYSRTALADKSERMNRTPPVYTPSQQKRTTNQKKKKTSPLVDALEQAETETEDEEEENVVEVLTYETFFTVAKDDLASKKTLWSLRVERLKRLAELFETTTEKSDPKDIQVLIPGLIVQLKENRSAVVREVSSTIQRLSKILKQKFALIAMKLIPIMLKSSASSNKVIASHVRKSVESVLSNTILPNFHHVVADLLKRNRGPRMANNCALCVEKIMNEWSNEDIEAQMKDVMEVLRKLLCHGSADARSHAQHALRNFHLRWSEECKSFLKTLP